MSVTAGQASVEGASNGSESTEDGSNEIALDDPEVVSEPAKTGNPILYPGYPDRSYAEVEVDV